MSYDVPKTHCKTLKLLKNNSNYFLKLIIPGWVGVHVSPSLRMTSFTELNLILHHFSMLRKLISALFVINTAIISTLSLCTRGLASLFSCIISAKFSRWWKNSVVIISTWSCTGNRDLASWKDVLQIYLQKP